ncbi:hypothetical protein [Pseudomonas extremaustralis]|uniref:Ead/Ea22-like family protein n=1 Tax=Pseudomonas extremaustralis TaxID=359110 RepID=A0A5C5Q7E3_9PSED|nr:hypothetical protein [Pseudomonas extremaustralis]EZI26390.1 hypothetical protein PE143B_0121635 [Pseudomonas extremaustralis 14-3 substr. 14-3b]TWS01622.1 hypothetical protein FIV36_23590 [Pseudomonas extremaustralis]SDE61347.1 hypothetical protein SAMN05216591_0378 [Pseudomonas extremaustralis]
MTDNTELKRLAEAAPEGPWFGPEYAPGTSYVFDVDLGTLLEYQSIDTEKDACLRYVAAANPAAVLSLIAENERLRADCSSMRGSLKANAVSINKLIKDGGRAARERAQLKAENERLATENSEIESAAITYIEDMQEAQHENERLTELFKVGMTLDGNLRVYGDWQSVRKAQEILAERDELRAEIAGLKTGYEAYEQVNAELKAENEELRANSSLVVLLPELDSVLEDLEIHGQHSDQGYRKLKDWYRKVDLACKAIDAAMGNGEQP